MLIPLQVNLRFEGHSEAEVQEKKAFLSTAKKKKKRKSNVLPSDNNSTLFIIALPAAINYDDNTLNNVNLWCSMGFDMSDYTHRVLQRVLRLVGGGDVQCSAVVKCFPTDIHVAKSSSPDDPMLHNHTKSESGLNQPPRSSSTDAEV